MRLLKFLAFVLVLQVIGWVPKIQAIDCEDLNKSSTDTVKVNQTSGRPGDTILVPIYFSTDSLVGSALIIIKFDTTKLIPIEIGSDTTIIIDTNINGGIDTLVLGHVYYDINITGRMKAVKDSILILNPTSTQEVTLLEKSFNPYDSGAILLEFNLNPFAQYLINMQPGSGVVATIPFIVSPTMNHKDTTIVRFHETDQFYIDSLGVGQNAGCRLSEFSLAFRHPAPSGDSLITNNVGSWPITRQGFIIADTAPLPNISSFTSNRTSITSGGFAILSWNVSNADSVVLFANNARILKTTALVDDTVVTPTITTAYQLIAYNGNGSVSANVLVTVSGTNPNPGGGGGGSTNFGPDIIRDPDDRTITINQFETLTIRVTGDDQNGDSIFLSLLEPPPANSTFLGDSANGTGTVERVFIFTPDETQTGAFNVRFACWDEFGGASANYLTIIVNPLDDILFTTSDTIPGRRAVGGVPGSSQILFPINFYTSQPIYGVQFDLTFDSIQLEIDSVFTTARTPGFTVYDNIGQVPGVVRVASFHLSGDSILTDTIPIMYAAFSVDSLAPHGLYEICIKNGFEAIDPNPNVFGLSVAGSCGVLQVDQFGDVNLDRIVNVVDVVNVIGVILGNFSLTPRQYAAGNVVVDANIDVFDMVGILNIIFNIPLIPTAGMEIPGIVAQMSLNYEDLEVGASDFIELDLDAPVDVAGVELIINYDPTAVTLGLPKIPDGANGLDLQSQDVGQGKMKILLTPTNILTTSDFIQQGKSTFLSIPITARKDIASGDETQLRLSKALLSTASAEALKVDGANPPLPAGFSLRQNYPNPFNPTTSIEFSIDIDAGIGQKDVRLDVFNILGQRVKTIVNGPLSTGTYKHVWDATNEAGKKVSTGMYLYRLEVGDAAQTKKMIFLK